MKLMEVYRHGEANYEQGFVKCINDANDLTPKGVIEVTAQAELLKEEVKKSGKRVTFLTSPTGRTVQTTAILESKILRTDSRVIFLKALQEQLGYSWSLMQLLVDGGEYESDGVRVRVDSNVTNPGGKSVYEYGVRDIRAIDPAYWSGKEVLQRRVEAIEGPEKVAVRIQRVLKAVQNNSTEDDLPVLVTHDAVIRPIMRAAGIEKEMVPTSGRVSISSTETGLYVVGATGNFLPTSRKISF